MSNLQYDVIKHLRSHFPITLEGYKRGNENENKICPSFESLSAPRSRQPLQRSSQAASEESSNVFVVHYFDEIFKCMIKTNFLTITK